jgi:hypothetical protein
VVVDVPPGAATKGDQHAMTARQQAEEGIKLLKEAVIAYLETRPEGATAAEIRDDLGLLDMNSKGQRKGYLLPWASGNGLTAS